MKPGRAKFLILVITLIVVGVVLVSRRPSTIPTPAAPTSTSAVPLVVETPTSNDTRFPTNPLGVVRAADLSPADKDELAKKFRDKFKPAIDKWFSAYGDRVPIQSTDITLDRFVERMGDKASYHLYTFVLGDFTFTVQESNESAKVSYLASRKAMIDLNRLSNEVPKTDLPVSREEVASMVKADTGISFKPNEVLMTPTGISCAMNGGANVRIGPPPNAPPAVSGPDKLDLIFGPDGKLAYYLRDPFF